MLALSLLEEIATRDTTPSRLDLLWESCRRLPPIFAVPVWTRCQIPRARVRHRRRGRGWINAGAVLLQELLRAYLHLRAADGLRAEEQELLLRLVYEEVVEGPQRPRREGVIRVILWTEGEDFIALGQRKDLVDEVPEGVGKAHAPPRGQGAYDGLHSEQRVSDGIGGRSSGDGGG